ncbi:unnamed protein product [Effrenium voratum]|nr:unnamed protein product [Effrenium voratum]|mmetsp:Transcript_117955/g.279994  ORF Transcript_117955/g.279994 Transcript_117955/m.279994 type:complete len:376 (-) Transcript_117955:53-1180(-)
MTLAGTSLWIPRTSRISPSHQTGTARSSVARHVRERKLQGPAVAAAAAFVAKRRRQGGRMPTCRLELMGLPDAAAYQRHAAGLLQKARAAGVLSGLNIPNKKPGEPLLEWAKILVRELPGVEVTVHYSLKHQRSPRVVEDFQDWCQQASSAGVRRVLLVTGPKGPRQDAVWVLQRLERIEGLRLGVAFNACLPTEAAREAERQRLVQKLRSGWVQDVWLNTGDDAELLRHGIDFVRETGLKLGVQPELFASVMLPSAAQLQQMRERPWNGVHFSEEFLSSVQGMGRASSRALAVFGDEVEPIVESKVRNAADLSKLVAYIDQDTQTLSSMLEEEDSCGPAMPRTCNFAPEPRLGRSRDGEASRIPRRWGKASRHA